MSAASLSLRPGANATSFDFNVLQFGSVKDSRAVTVVALPREKTPLTRADIDLNSKTRFEPLPTDDGFQIRNPFSDRPMLRRDVQWDDERWNQFSQNFESGYAQKINRGALLGRGGQHDVYATNTGLVIRAAGKTFYAERMLMLQGVLEYFGIPHLRLRDDGTAIGLALEFGATLQSRLPVGSRSLDRIVQGWDDRWEDVLEKVENDLGRRACEELIVMFDRFYSVSNDLTLLTEGYRRGYAVSSGLWSEGDLNTSSLIDSLGGGNWGANLFYHPDYGWFLVDW